MKYTHSKESALTTPDDRDKVNRWKPEQFVEPLTNEESIHAVDELNNTTFIEKFPRVDRTYADDPVPMQNFALFSFMPAKGAKPNDNGIFGFAKIRGSYSNQMEANQRAEYIVRKLDSYNKIFHTYVGRPFPVTIDSRYSAETSEIDIRKQMTETVSQNIKSSKDDDYKTMQEMKEKEDALLQDVKNEEVDPYEDYITQRVKLAQLSFTYLEHQKKMVEIKDIIIKTREKVTNFDEKYPEFKDSYYKKYMDARDSAGIKESEEDTQGNFIKYLVSDADLGF